MSTARVTALRPGGGRRWTRPAGRAVDLATGAGSVWTLASDPDGSGSRLTRWSPTGRRIGTRSLPGAATALAVSGGAVWVANGCARGVARAPVGPGPVACLGGRWGAGDVAAGRAGAWVADADGARALRLGPDGRLEGRARVPGRPVAVACHGGVAWVVDAAGGLTRVG
jgi:sugar lactone lactonase YvrE